MKDQHVKGVINTVVGTVEEAAGKVAGDPELEIRGTVRRVKGAVQQRVGDVEEALRKPAPRY